MSYKNSAVVVNGIDKKLENGTTNNEEEVFEKVFETAIMRKVKLL